MTDFMTRVVHTWEYATGDPVVDAADHLELVTELRAEVKKLRNVATRFYEEKIEIFGHATETPWFFTDWEANGDED